MYTKELGLTLINYDQPINGQFTVMNIGHQGNNDLIKQLIELINERPNEWRVPW